MELVVLLLIGVELTPHFTPTLGPSSFSSLTPFVIKMNDDISYSCNVTFDVIEKHFSLGSFCV